MNRVGLLVLDFINDIAHPNGKIARSAARIAKNRVIEKANQVIEWARAHQALIIQVKVAFSSNYRECPRHSPLFGQLPQHGALQLGTWGTEFHEQLDVRPEDSVVVKHRVNAFYGTNLEVILRAQEIDTVVIIGTATNMAVEATARDAHDRDYQVMVVADACETAEQAQHEAALNSMARFTRVVQAAELSSSNLIQ